jgi:hypothetical protein
VRLGAPIEEFTSDGLLVMFDGELKMGPSVRRYLMPIWTDDAGPRRSAATRPMLGALLHKAAPASSGNAPDGSDMLEWLADAERMAGQELYEVAERLYQKELGRVQPRRLELQDRFERRLMNSRSRISELKGALREAELDETRLELAKQCRTKLRRAERYQKEIVQQREHALRELGEIPLPESGVVPVGACWVQVQ